jgi:phosphohistidine phosphatase
MPLLYLIRHGVAHDQGREGTDFTRELTPKGVDKVKRQAEAMLRSGLIPARLVASPLDRARQTAELLGQTWGVPVQIDRALGLGAQTEAYLDALLAGEGSVACVGHNPDISYAVQQLTGARVQMRKGMMAVVELPNRHAAQGLLRGCYDPDVLAGLA